MHETETGKVSTACIVTLTRRDVRNLVREGWQLVGEDDGPQVLFYLNAAERDPSFDKYEQDVYARCNVALESLYRLMRGETFRWGTRYRQPLYVDSDGVDADRLPG